jgi:hypothetical protein
MASLRPAWAERTRDGVLIFEPAAASAEILVAFSGRGMAPTTVPSPTEFLARRFANALDRDGAPIVRATQVHGRRAVIVREVPPSGTVIDAGECDVLATDLPGVALAVQTADCVAILLAGQTAVAAVHAGWRGTAQNAAGAAVASLSELGEKPARVRAWLGPAIGACCYEVGPEVASGFATEFLRVGRAGRPHLDLPAANRAQLAAAGLVLGNVQTHPACTRCGGEGLASYRRDGTGAGRMIGLVLRRH